LQVWLCFLLLPPHPSSTHYSKLELTVVILTYNEAPNIGRCLDRLRWASRVVIVDSFSDDDTLAIAGCYSNVKLVSRRFDNHTNQWNFGLQQSTTPWVLSLDADYIVKDDLVAEIGTIHEDCSESAFYIPFRYCIFGKPLKGSLYPPRAALFRKDSCRYEADGHTQLLHISGKAGRLSSCIDHDDRKPLTRWLSSQDKYAVLESEKLFLAESSSLGLQDKIRQKVILAPLIVLVYVLVVKGLIFCGWSGWYYAFQRMLAEIVLSLRLIEKRLMH
jgi:glycosyltransferase involved in cell wall biosynthesis